MSSYQEWPFLSANNRSTAQTERWWQECFVRTYAIESFLSMKHSAAVVGGPGTGKSTALDALMWEQSKQALCLIYPPERWPQGKHPLRPGEGHAAQIWTAAATQFNDILTQDPSLFSRLDDLHKRFLGWLIGLHLNLRVWQRLIHRINQSLGLTLELPESIPDLYKTNTNPLDVKLQLSELVELAQGFGYEKIYLIVDVPEAAVLAHVDDIKTLFGWSNLLEQAGFVVRAALPTSAIVKAQIKDRSSARLNLIALEDNESERNMILQNHVQAATEGHLNLDSLLNDALHTMIETEITTLYGTPAIAGWLNWLETLLWVNKQPKSPGPSELKYTYYRRHVPLLLDTRQQGVWRGPQFLGLDKQPFEILQKLFELRGQPAPDALFDLAGSSTNLNTLASRIRKIIEPGTKPTVYLQNRRDTSYWLENFVLNE